MEKEEEKEVEKRFGPWEDFDDCMTEMTKNGVTLKEMEDIITKYGDNTLKYRRDLQVHINCRHTISPI